MLVGRKPPPVTRNANCMFSSDIFREHLSSPLVQTVCTPLPDMFANMLPERLQHSCDVDRAAALTRARC